jgi:hypothetical protein
MRTEAGHDRSPFTANGTFADERGGHIIETIRANGHGQRLRKT